MRIGSPKTLKEAREKMYGAWAGSGGTKYQEGRCAEQVWTRERWSRSHQCSKKNGHGPEGLFCKVHDPDAVKAREDKQMLVYNLEQAAHNHRWHSWKMYLALKKIRDGHNDPRALARELLDEVGDCEAAKARLLALQPKGK